MTARDWFTLIALSWFPLSFLGLVLGYRFSRYCMYEGDASLRVFLRRIWYHGLINYIGDGDGAGSDAGNLFLLLGGLFTFIIGLIGWAISFLWMEPLES